ncbi:hypothetical protein CK203_015802 [Vitis vinifera]|uniref:DUF4283 domain-containing protein n=1 Tax=Vitis vinifera TaxID=29760 RepID=A0A438JRP0_VITVI|nr:hypothetical protein CK203_015802 [Vitis vinifera]
MKENFHRASVIEHWLKGCIWERSRGLSLGLDLGRLVFVVFWKALKPVVERWMIKDGLLNGWRDNRKFRMERRLNKAGRFILCSVRDMEAKRYSIIFPEGKGQASGWNALAVRLRGLGVTPTEGLKISNVPEIPVKPKGVLKVQWKEKGVEMKSFAEAVKSSPRRAGESVWLEVGENEVRGRLEHLKHCLIGRWGSASVPPPELDFVRSWTRQIWEVKGKLSIAALGRGIMLFEFDQAQEAERVLARGKRSLKDNWLILDKWNPEVFKSIGDGCGGFIAVDEGTKSMSELQWARILVKRVDWEVPSSVHIALGTGCFALHLWWESAPWFSQVVLAGSSSGKGGLRAGEEVDGLFGWLAVGVKEGDGAVGAAGGGPSKSSGPSVSAVGKPKSLIGWIWAGVQGPIPAPLVRGMSGEAGGPIQARALLDESRRKRRSRSPRGLPRDSTARVSSQMMDRGFLTDEALCEEASRYVYLCHIPLGGRDLSSPSSSSFGRVTTNEGTTGVSFSEANEEEQTPLCIILADGSKGVLVSEGDQNPKMSQGVIHSLGVGRFLGWGAVDARGAAGGVVVFWDKRVWSWVYGPTMKRFREPFWEELGAIRGLWTDPWCIGGDFNVIRFPRGSLYVEWGVKWPILVEIGSLPDFGGLGKHFSGVSQCTLPRPVSDHCPILLDGGGVKRGPIPFRFENMWLRRRDLRSF